ncbi:conserved hypothetical protein [Sinorhizobium medicae]|uniref:Uncharacterized protein n=1 Tax=Sinorhizobium medicae TaxID=110321 RepID=A0A508WVW4_9HYPH|nr:conserved hypothetical protein [Sinorhizobium medicae]
MLTSEANAHFFWEEVDELENFPAGHVLGSRTGLDSRGLGPSGDPDHCHREQWRHDPDAEADGRFHVEKPGHPTRVGHS